MSTHCLIARKIIGRLLSGLSPVGRWLFGSGSVRFVSGIVMIQPRNELIWINGEAASRIRCGALRGKSSPMFGIGARSRVRLDEFSQRADMHPHEVRVDLGQRD